MARLIGTVVSGGLMPGSPSISNVTEGDGQATITFTAPNWTGKGTGTVTYTATSNPGNFTGNTTSGNSIVVTGLTNGTSYTFTVAATTSYGITSASSAASDPVVPVVPIQGSQTGVVGGGYLSGSITNISYWNIASAGNGASFGNLSQKRTAGSGAGSTTRGVFIAGVAYPENSFLSGVEYIQFATTGNATNFGSISGQPAYQSSNNSGQRAVICGGYNRLTTMDYLTISTTGNSTNFGNCSSADVKCGAMASPTRIVMPQSYNTGYEYITTATTGNTTSFGNRYVNSYYAAGTSSATRGMFAAGLKSAGANRTVEYITIATTGNGTNFGDLRRDDITMRAGSSNCITAVFANGDGCSDMDSFTIATTGNYTNFGTMPNTNGGGAGTSGSHGGNQ